MSQFKNNPKLKLFYTDTDSIYLLKQMLAAADAMQMHKQASA